MRRAYKFGASNAAPSAAQATSAGFPTEGDVAQGIPATIPGPFVFYMLVEAIVTVIEQAGLQPGDDPNQFRDAVLALIESMSSDLEIASIGETLAGALDNKAVSPAGVRAVRDALLGGAPGALDTLNEIAEALNDDANAYDTLLAAINQRQTQADADARYARVAGDTFTGTVRGPTPPAGDDSTRLATTAWIADFFGAASSREFAAAGETTYTWEWDTPSGLAIISGAGGGGYSGSMGIGPGADGAQESASQTGPPDDGTGLSAAGGGASRLSIVGGLTYWAGGGGAAGDRGGNAGVDPVRGNYYGISGDQFTDGIGPGGGGDGEAGGDSGLTPDLRNKHGGNGIMRIVRLGGMVKGTTQLVVELGQGGAGGRGSIHDPFGGNGSDGRVELFPLF